MTEPKASGTTDQAPRQRALRSVESLFRHCDKAQNPVLAYSRACSKVGYLARDAVRSELHYLVSALNERKHAWSMQRCGQPEQAKQHARACGEDLRSFLKAVRVERQRLPTPAPELREQQFAEHHGRVHRADVALGRPASITRGASARSAALVPVAPSEKMAPSITAQAPRNEVVRSNRGLDR
jgi:hypothetical protein